MKATMPPNTLFIERDACHWVTEALILLCDSGNSKIICANSRSSNITCAITLRLEQITVKINRVPSTQKKQNIMWFDK